MGDFVIALRIRRPAIILAVTVYDHLQGITRDARLYVLPYASSWPVQKLLGYETPRTRTTRF